MTSFNAASDKTISLSSEQTIASEKIKRLLIQFWIDNGFFSGYMNKRFSGRMAANRIPNGKQIEWWSDPLCENLTPTDKNAIGAKLESAIQHILREHQLHAVRFETEWHHGQYVQILFEEQDYMWIPWTAAEQAQKVLNKMPPTANPTISQTGTPLEFLELLERE